MSEKREGSRQGAISMLRRIRETGDIALVCLYLFPAQRRKLFGLIRKREMAAGRRWLKKRNVS
jgi:hypothetical protein